MKRFLCSFLIVIIFLSLLTSCKMEEFLKTDSPHLLLTACVFYSVPGFYQSDIKGITADIVEEDDYGRVLLSFNGYNEFTDKEERAYVICQRYSNSTIFFYENINYIFENDSNTNLENLKKENDWNSKIDETKFSSRKIYVSVDLCLVNDSPFSKLSNEKFYLSLKENCGINKDSVASVGYCDWDGENKVLYFINLDNGEQYFCIVDTDYNTSVVKIEKTYDFYEEICNLKNRSNWNYGK